MDNTLVAAYCDRGISKARAGNSQEALEDINHAISLDPTFSKAYLNRWIIRLNLNDIAGACMDFAQANSPVNEKATYYLNKYCK